jgi:enoyl-CoA hydratase/carnithine racemase
MRLNRPERLNAFSREMYVALDEVVTEAATDESLRALVITGTGRSFSTGGDLKQHMERRNRGETWDPREYIAPSNHAFETLVAMHVPTLAVVNGLAYAAGLIVTLCCDYAIASDDAKFCVPEARTGRAEPWTAALLASRIGRRHAAALVLSGEPVDAKQAESMGIVHRVVARDELEGEAERQVNAMLRGSPAAQRHYRRILGTFGSPAFDLTAIHETIFSADTLEGTTAFVEKRDPAWVETWTWPA